MSGDADIIDIVLACKNVVGTTNVEVFDAKSATPGGIGTLTATDPAVTKFIKPPISITGMAEVSNLDPNAAYRVSVSDLLFATGVVQFAFRIEDGFFADSQMNVLSDWVEVSDSGYWVLDGKHWTKAFELGRPGGTGASWRGDILEVVFDCADASGSKKIFNLIQGSL